MNALLLENDQVITSAFDVKWSVNESFIKSNVTMFNSEFYIPKVIQEIEFNIKCNHNFITEIKKLDYTLILKNSFKLLYGVYPKCINQHSNFYEISFIVDHYAEIYDSDYVKNIWIKYNRDNKIKEILG